ncbi:hypothetical protein ACFQ07_01500 [Actinomadura adrarensis]|uniref:Uncharacterized protein n=1 Tax=Actinomadura adrarensis TaxID=1819600 RepID=A0ABW3CB24_9ACTN
MTEPDPERTIAQLNRRFPRASIWLGEFTGRYWALIRDRFGHDHLIEAATPADLSNKVAALLPRPHAPLKNRHQGGLPTVSSPRKPSGLRTGDFATAMPRPHRHANKHASLFGRLVRSLFHRDAAPRQTRGHR